MSDLLSFLHNKIATLVFKKFTRVCHMIRVSSLHTIITVMGITHEFSIIINLQIRCFMNWVVAAMEQTKNVTVEQTNLVRQ